VNLPQNSGLNIGFFQHSSISDIGLHTQCSHYFSVYAYVCQVFSYFVSFHGSFKKFFLSTLRARWTSYRRFLFSLQFCPNPFPFIVLIFLSVCFK